MSQSLLVALDKAPEDSRRIPAWLQGIERSEFHKVWPNLVVSLVAEQSISTKELLYTLQTIRERYKDRHDYIRKRQLGGYCVHGHKLTRKTALLIGRSESGEGGQWVCKICRREASRRHRARKKQS